MDTATATRTQKRRKKTFAEYRTQVKTWFPKASDLPLTHLTEEVAAHIRRRLAPWLGSLPVRGGNCWEVAQSLVMAAGDDSGVKYVEGVWKRSWELHEPVPHGWVTVDGHRVDLTKEFYSWRCGDDEWVYEPLAEFTYSRLVELYETSPDYGSPDCPEGDISTMLWVESVDGRSCGPDAYSVVFGPAKTRMMERHATAAAGATEAQELGQGATA